MNEGDSSGGGGAPGNLENQKGLLSWDESDYKRGQRSQAQKLGSCRRAALPHQSVVAQPGRGIVGIHIPID